MTDQEFDGCLMAYRGRFRDLNARDGAIYIVTPEQVVGGGFVITPEETIDVMIDDVPVVVSGFTTEYRTRMDGNQTPLQGTVVAVLG
jgi:hypothetical protein